uniref:Uncharacterized protein n=1 Tax=Glossina pallidipes TaxID=7398 RepID=A0A1B0AEK2_GLOPL
MVQNGVDRHTDASIFTRKVVVFYINGGKNRLMYLYIFYALSLALCCCSVYFAAKLVFILNIASEYLIGLYLSPTFRSLVIPAQFCSHGFAFLTIINVQKAIRVDVKIYLGWIEHHNNGRAFIIYLWVLQTG